MKKTRIIIALSLVLALGLIFTGCSCSKDSGKTNTTSNNTATTNASTTNSTNATNSTDTANNSIVGTWKYDKGLDYDADFSYTFNPDGTGKLVDRLGNMDYNFTYQLNGDKMIYTLEGANTKEYLYSINGNTLLVVDSKGRNIYHTREQ